MAYLKRTGIYYSFQRCGVMTPTQFHARIMGLRRADRGSEEFLHGLSLSLLRELCESLAADALSRIASEYGSANAFLVLRGIRERVLQRVRSRRQRERDASGVPAAASSSGGRGVLHVPGWRHHRSGLAEVREGWYDRVCLEDDGFLFFP